MQDRPITADNWQQLYEQQQLLSATEDMWGVLQVLGKTAAGGASALVHIAFDPIWRQFTLAHQIVRGVETRPAERLNVSFDDVSVSQDVVGFAADSLAAPDSAGQLAQRFGAGSHAWLVLRDEDQIHDVLLALYDQPRTFDSHSQRLFEAFAQQASTVVRAQRQLHEARGHSQHLERQVRVLETLNLLANSIGGDSDEQALMDATMQTLVEASGADHAAIAIIEPNGLTAVVRSEYPVQGALGAVFPVEANPIFNTLLKDRYSPILIDDLHNDERVTPAVFAVLDPLGIKSLVIAPLNVGGRVIGSVGLDLYTTERKFTPDIVELADVLTGQLALYVHGTRLRQERRRIDERTAAIERIANRFAALNRADDLMLEAARGLHDVFKARRIAIRLLDDPGGQQPNEERAE